MSRARALEFLTPRLQAFEHRARPPPSRASRHPGVSPAQARPFSGAAAGFGAGGEPVISDVGIAQVKVAHPRARRSARERSPRGAAGPSRSPPPQNRPEPAVTGASAGSAGDAAIVPAAPSMPPRPCACAVREAIDVLSSSGNSGDALNELGANAANATMGIRRRSRAKRIRRPDWRSRWRWRAASAGGLGGRASRREPARASAPPS